MQERAFPYVPTRIAGQGFKYLFPVKCSRCGAEKDFESYKIMPDVVIHKRFMQWGWLLGRNRSHDLCPTCLGVTRENRLAAKFKVVQNSEPVLAPIEVVQQAAEKRQSLEKAVHEGLMKKRVVRELVEEVKEVKALLQNLIDVMKVASAPKKRATTKKAVTS